MEIKKIQELSEGIIGNFPLYIHWWKHQPETEYHSHDFTELVLVCAGSGIHAMGTKRQTVQKGDCFVVSQKQSHAYFDCSDDFQLINILFIPELLPLPLLDAPLMPGFREFYFCAESSENNYPFLHLEDEDFAQVFRLTKELFQEIQTRSSGYLFNKLVIFGTILGKLARLYSQKEKNTKHFHIRTSAVISYINTHFKEDIPEEKLCSLACLSASGMRRNFIRLTGVSPLQYQLQLRISEAAVLLKTTGKSISEIAFETGFTDNSYFGRQFKRIIGQSPGAYRREYVESSGS